MAFILHDTYEINPSFLNDYPESDSEDHFMPRTQTNIVDFMHPNFVQGSSFCEQPNDNLASSMQYTLEEERKRCMDVEMEEIDLNTEITPYYYEGCEKADSAGNETLKSSLRKIQSKGTDEDMDIEETDLESNQSAAFIGCFEAMISMNPLSLDSCIKSEMESFAGLAFSEESKSKDMDKRTSGPLRGLIDNLLQGKPLNGSEIAGLNEFEQMILVLIRLRKTQKGEAKATKRKEEKQKLFFKSALKHIENRFLTNISKANNDVRKMDIDPDLFYLSYFQDVAIAKNLDISSFYPPSKQRRYPGVKSEIKSFNSRYIELLLSSKRFLEETVYYLQDEFVQNYSKSRLTKIDKLLKKTTNIYEQTLSQFGKVDEQNHRAFAAELRSQLHDALIKNAKIKLPWTNSELEEAQGFAKQAIFKFLENGTLLH